MIVDTKAIVSRLCEAWRVTKYKDLAVKLSVGESTVSSWVNNSRIPFNECIDTVIKRGCTLDWLIFGNHAQALFESPLKDAVKSALSEACDIELIDEISPPIINSIANMALRDYKKLAQIDLSKDDKSDAG